MSDLAMTPELTKAIQDAVNPTDMRALVQAELAKQTAAAAVSDTEQKAAETARLAAAAVVTPEVYTRTEVIGGREFLFEAESEAELDREVLNVYKIAYAVQPTPQAATPVVPVVDVAKEAELEAIRQVELEAKFKRGEISTADYLEQSGAMSAYLAKQGIPVESLKATVERNADAVETQSWADAVEAFKQSPSGASWPGGDKNVMVMNDKIFALGLQDATDKVAALAQAYAAMQSSGTVFPGEAAAAAVTPVVAAPVASAAAAAVAAPAAVVPVVRTASQSSTLFGTSSGANEGVSTIAPKGDVKIDPLASPQEILEQWKRANVAAGKDPNAAFVETYSAKRA